MDTYSVRKGYGHFQWFVVVTHDDGTSENYSEHNSRTDAETAAFFGKGF